jgi:arylsulfatase A-like enzyme
MIPSKNELCNVESVKGSAVDYCLFCLWIFGFLAGTSQATVNLFTDSFDRPNNNNISASTAGMSGLAAPMTYVERGDAIVPNDALTRIFSNALRLADGPNASTLYLNHNFIDSKILECGGMRIGLKIVSNNGSMTSADHFVGFGVGNTLQECQNILLDYNGIGFRGRANHYAGTSDLWVGWSPNAGGTIQLFKNGPTSHGGQNYNAATGIALTGSDLLEMELAISDFHAGSVVIAKILWNAAVIHTTTFQWDQANQNHIGICARQSDQGFTVDDFVVEAVSSQVCPTISVQTTPSFVQYHQHDVPVTLTWSAEFVNAGSTYAVTADKPVVFPQNGDTGLASNGTTSVEVLVDGALGDVTFTVTLYESGEHAVARDSATVRQIPPQNPGTPNFIVILTDDQGWGTTSVHMDPEEPNSKSDFFETPNLERLAQSGLRFTQGYSAHPNCSPSRAALLTGRSPAALHFTDIVGRNSGVNYEGLPMIPATHINGLPEAEMTIPELLKQHNAIYTAAHFGKWHLSGGGPNNHGFDVSDGATGNAAGTGQPPDDPKQIFGITQRGNDWMEQQVLEGKPFYLQLSHYATHESSIDFRPETKLYFDAKQPGIRHTHAGYAAMLYDLDEGIGRTLDKVIELGIQGNTYIIYTADNGTRPMSIPENINGPLRGWKATVWEGGIRVPFMVAGPGVAENSVSREPVAGYDILPTICQLAGIAWSVLPPTVEGGSFAHLMNGGSGPIVRAREGLVFHWPHYQVEKFSTPNTTLLLEGYKLHYRWETQKKQLFSLDRDLAETTDLALIENTLADRFADMLFTHLSEIGARLPRPNPDYAAECWNRSDGPPNDFMGRDPSVFDLNDDCFVDIDDLAILVGRWLDPEPAYDFYGSDRLDFRVLEQFSKHWQSCWRFPTELHCY